MRCAKSACIVAVLACVVLVVGVNLYHRSKPAQAAEPTGLLGKSESELRAAMGEPTGCSDYPTGVTVLVYKENDEVREFVLEGGKVASITYTRRWHIERH